MWSRDAEQRLTNVDETFRRCIDVGAALCRHSPCRILFRSGKTDKNDKRRVGSMITSVHHLKWSWHLNWSWHLLWS